METDEIINVDFDAIRAAAAAAPKGLREMYFDGVNPMYSSDGGETWVTEDELLENGLPGIRIYSHEENAAFIEQQEKYLRRLAELETPFWMWEYGWDLPPAEAAELLIQEYGANHEQTLQESGFSGYTIVPVGQEDMPLIERDLESEPINPSLYNVVINGGWGGAMISEGYYTKADLRDAVQEDCEQAVANGLMKQSQMEDILDTDFF